MLHFGLPVPASHDVDSLPRVCAVSYLNTLPLVWGMLRGPQSRLFELSFAVPSLCADRLAAGQADIGIVPCVEIPRLGLQGLRGIGIASTGTVRSILLISKTDPRRIRSLAADSSSRTSVALARIILARRYGCEPELVSMAPDLGAMLSRADAALIIGDPALRVEPAALRCPVLDLGLEWRALTGLPMVYAAWAGRPDRVRPEWAEAFEHSYRYGAAHLDEILDSSERDPSIPRALAERYLTQNVVYELGAEEYAGMDLFLAYAAELAGSPVRS
jgi:chorismate dehydratase